MDDLSLLQQENFDFLSKSTTTFQNIKKEWGPIILFHFTVKIVNSMTNQISLILEETLIFYDSSQTIIFSLTFLGQVSTSRPMKDFFEGKATLPLQKELTTILFC